MGDPRALPARWWLAAAGAASLGALLVPSARLAGAFLGGASALAAGALLARCACQTHPDDGTTPPLGPDLEGTLASVVEAVAMTWTDLLGGVLDVVRPAADSPRQKGCGCS